MRKCNIMLLAAGLGTRLRPYTDQVPKPCIGLNQIPLGFYLFPYFKDLEISKFVVNTFHLSDQIKNMYQNLLSIWPIQFSDESGTIKESGGGLKQAETLFDLSVPILLCNSDEVLFTKKSNFVLELIEFHQSRKNFASLVVIEHPEAGIKFGAIWTDHHNNVIGIGKNRPTVDAKPWHFIGIQLLDTQVLELIPKDEKINIFYDFLINHLSNRIVKVFPIQADWYETGNADDYHQAKKNILEKTETNQEYEIHYSFLNHLIQKLDIQVSDLP